MPQPPVPLPRSVDELLSPEWLTQIMQSSVPGCRVVEAKVRQNIRVVATKVRIRLTYAEGDPQGPTDLCVKAFLDADAYQASLAWISLNEARFYERVASHVPMRVPFSPFAAVDADAGRGIIVMEDLAARGARFLSSVEPVGVDLVAQSVEQLAGLHAAFARDGAMHDFNWLVSVLAMMGQMPTDGGLVQELLDGTRGKGLAPDVLDVERLNRSLRMAAELERGLPSTVLHGDCHCGNLYELPEGPGFLDWQLVQTGNWARDVAYHIGSSLTVEEAESNERDLVDHYLDAYRAAGGEVSSRIDAWDLYRSSVLYGYYCWVVTIRVDENIIVENVRRLGHAMLRHDTLDRIERLAS